MLQNDGDVKIVVGNNFDDIVLDESKDVLLEVALGLIWSMMSSSLLCSLAVNFLI